MGEEEAEFPGLRAISLRRRSQQGGKDSSIELLKKKGEDVNAIRVDRTVAGEEVERTWDPFV